MRPPMRIVGGIDIKQRKPANREIFGRNSSMIWGTVSLRSLRGLSRILMRLLLRWRRRIRRHACHERIDVLNQCG